VYLDHLILTILNHLILIISLLLTMTKMINVKHKERDNQNKFNTQQKKKCIGVITKTIGLST